MIPHQTVNGNGAHGLPGLAPKGGSMSRLPLCELLGLRARVGLRTHRVEVVMCVCMNCVYENVLFHASETSQWSVVCVSECDSGNKHT
jgi:hypothetical protein